MLQDSEGNWSIVRWPQGAQDSIIVPPHPNCRIGNRDIVATFHTHPNMGDDYLQEPGETDRRAVRDDSDLKGIHYEGELVISSAIIYLIEPNGLVSEIGKTQEVFAEL